MKNRNIVTALLTLFVILTYSCVDQKRSKLNLTFKISPESSDTYIIQWYDTLGLSEGYTDIQSIRFIKRPKEIWCFITNIHNDTLGYYQGLSTANTFTYFNSNDSIIILNFMVGLNPFSDYHINDANERKRYPIKFTPVKFNMNTELKRMIEVELTEQ